MRYLFSILFPLSLIFLSSCVEDFHANLPKEKSRLVINAILGRDSLVRIHIGSSKSLDASVNDTGVDKAKVLIKRDGELLGNMSHTYNGWYHLENQHLNLDGTYELKVMHPEYPPLTTTAILPPKVPILNLNYSIEKNSKIEFTVEFEDDPKQTNYYMLILNGKNEGVSVNIEYFSNDIAFNGNLSESPIGIQQNMLRGSRTFSDNNAKNNICSISFYLTDFSFDFINYFTEYQVKLYHITEDYFKYERSLINFDNREYLPFFKKVNLHSNINGGYGIFSTYAVDSKSIKIND